MTSVPLPQPLTEYPKGREASSSRIDQILSQYKLVPREEKTHQKVMRTFFFIHCIGQLLRVVKLQPDSQENASGNGGNVEGEPLEEGSTIVIDGIFNSCDANSTHLILNEAAILRVYGDDPFNPQARSDLIRRSAQASIKMSEVKELRFVGIDVNKNGVQRLEVKDNQIAKKLIKGEKKLKQRSVREQALPLNQNQSLGIKEEQKNSTAASPLVNQEPEKAIKAKTTTPHKAQPLQERQLPFDGRQQQPLKPTQQRTAEPKKRRELQRHPFQSTSAHDDIMMELTRGNDSTHFDQYAANKTTSTYNPELYTSTFDKTKITSEQEELASKVEKELRGRERSPVQHDDEEMASAVENVRPKAADQAIPSAMPSACAPVLPRTFAPVQPQQSTVRKPPILPTQDDIEGPTQNLSMPPQPTVLNNRRKFSCMNSQVSHDFMETYGENKLENRLQESAIDAFQFQLDYFKDKAREGEQLSPFMNALLETIQREGQEETEKRLDLSQFAQKDLASENWCSFNK